MPTNDYGITRSDANQNAGADTGLVCAKDAHNGVPDTWARKSAVTMRLFRTAGLSQAHDILRGEVPYSTCLSPDHLWKSYSLDDRVLAKVKQHLTNDGWFSNAGSWYFVNEEGFARQDKGDGEVKTFAVFSSIFNAVLDYFRTRGSVTSVLVHVGSIEPKSTTTSSNRPDAFLQMNTRMPPTSTEGKFRWRDLTCPFEYKFGNGDTIDNDTKALWSLHHIMRSDLRRMFSFGSTVWDAKLRIWLLYRAAPFTFTPFNWLEVGAVFFIILATSSKTDLGFDANIERTGESDFDLRFTVQGSRFHTSKLLHDIGAGAPCGRGTWVFEVVDQDTKKVRVIKDCWVEDHSGGQMEHDIVASIKKEMDDGKFREHFVDLCGHRRKDAAGGFNNVCRILTTRTFMLGGHYTPQPLVPAPDTPKPTYDDQEKGSIGFSDQSPHLRPPSPKAIPGVPLHPRFRYQVIYSERGTALYEVTKFGRVFGYLDQATGVLQHLHEAGWVHRDLSPGSIIVAEGKAKISDLGFARRRAVDQLDQLTRPKDPSQLAAKDTRMGTLLFTAAEVEYGAYQFLPPLGRNLGGEKEPEGLQGMKPGTSPRGQKVDGAGSTVNPRDRIFFYNLLHDYESVWWIAVWFVFECRPEGVTDDLMAGACDKIRKNRHLALAAGMIYGLASCCRGYFDPLESFDGSWMLSIVTEFRDMLRRLETLARGLGIDVTLPGVRLGLNTTEVNQFDAVALEGEQGHWGQTEQQEQHQTEGQERGEQSLDNENLPIDGQAESAVLGRPKRALYSRRLRFRAIER